MEVRHPVIDTSDKPHSHMHLTAASAEKHGDQIDSKTDSGDKKVSPPQADAKPTPLTTAAQKDNRAQDAARYEKLGILPTLICDGPCPGAAPDKGKARQPDDSKADTGKGAGGTIGVAGAASGAVKGTEGGDKSLNGDSAAQPAGKIENAATTAASSGKIDNAQGTSQATGKVESALTSKANNGKIESANPASQPGSNVEAAQDSDHHAGKFVGAAAAAAAAVQAAGAASSAAAHHQ